MSWVPPLTLEERLKALFVPPRLALRYKVAREKASGEPELRLVPFLADRARISVDVGANKGVWAEVMRHVSREVHAFEPNPKIFKHLRRSAGAGVVSHNIALSNHSGRDELRVPRGSRGYSNQGASLSATKIGDAAYRGVVVETRRLDDYDIGEVGLIKIDVEGHESEVIEGARATLDRYRPNLVVEIEEKHIKRPVMDLLTQVCSHGYEAFALDRGVLRPAARVSQCARQLPRAVGQKCIINWIFLPH